MTNKFDEILSQSLALELGIPEGLVDEGLERETDTEAVIREHRSGETSRDAVDRLFKRPVRVSPALGAPYAGEPATSGDVQGAPTTHRILPEGFDAMPSVEGYEVLSAILATAYQQAATGKGRERHSTGPLGFQPWHMQPIMSIGRQVGPGGHAYQIAKKAQESVTMEGNGNYEGAKAEALGAIIYAAALYRLYQEMEAASG